MLKLSIIFLSLFFTQCTSIPPSAERKNLQWRKYEGIPFDKVFKAYRKVLESEGCIIKLSHSGSGVIVGWLTSSDPSSLFWNTVHSINLKTLRPSERIEVSVNIELISSSLVEARLSLQLTETTAFGEQKGKELFDAPAFAAIYQRVKDEITDLLHVQMRSQVAEKPQPPANALSLPQMTIPPQ